ncbi:Metallo-dependent phosphatase [Schizopora paradoxa]|uniref:Serine/threonine-protein phosphatase n=1 Tax=Schizopora paradoxa TaxID=27342 RepID=A0A0H2R5L6_9AGAM|nr:Metallo-dependent phosphatase [Schizopora paradoxa]
MPEDETYLHKALSNMGQNDTRSVPTQQQQRTPLQRSQTQAAFFEQCKMRQVPGVPEPAWHKPTDLDLFPPSLPSPSAPHGAPNTELIRTHFLREGKLHEHQALRILAEAEGLLRGETNLLDVGGPITVCGDVHGQYYDLLKIFEIGGDPANNTYLFLGDYVDRGCFGIECLLYLYSLKIRYPKRIYLLRGNHECRHLTEYFTFHRECVRKYSKEVYEACIKSFQALPLAAVLDNRFLCVHGGLSPELNMLGDVNMINRFQEPPSHGLLCDLLWSDPIANFGHEQEPTANQTATTSMAGPVPAGTSFLHNPVRGCSFFFTYDAACAFLERNNLLGILRGHEVQNNGYNMYRKTPHKKFPSVITIFSAPNYCDFYHNRGAVLKYANKNITIRQFNASGHPYWLPNFMDGFTWSLPFVGDKIVQMLLAILACCTAEELEESSSEEEVGDGEGTTARDAEALAAARRQQIKNKILAVGRMRRVFQILREEAETASELNQAMEASGMAAIRARGANKDELGVQTNQIRRAIRTFDDARRKDEFNERLPTLQPSPIPSSPSGSGTATPATPANLSNSMSTPRPAFPLVQAPSTRRRPSYHDDIDLEERFRRTLHLNNNNNNNTGANPVQGTSGGTQEDEDEDEDERELHELAERIALGGRGAKRPQALKRHETV